MSLLALLVASRLFVPIRTVVDAAGTYCVKGAKECVALVLEEGESLCVTLMPSRARPKHGCDVTAFSWLSPHEVIFSTASVYGTPGIYRYDLRHRSERTVIPSRTKDYAYPEGKDYFKLIAVAGDEITFWYCADIDKLDESALDRTATRERATLTKTPAK